MMKKKFLTFGILLVVLTGILIPHVAFGQIADAGKAVAASLNPLAGLYFYGKEGLSEMAGSLFKALGQFLITISSLFLILSGKLFDFVVKFTIIDMSKNFSEYGIDKSITDAWVTLRDIANLCFIFVLLFAAFKAMFDTNFGGYGKTIINIIIVALLINFSLFFSKVVIDASNVVSLGFYKSIASANSYSLKGTEGNFGFDGISGGYMRMLGLQTFYGNGVLENVQGGPIAILTFGILSSIFLLITAIVLLIAGIMFAARFIILVFLMVLSPLALIAFIIPGMNKHFGEWKESLISQSFFAPLYFAMTWVVFKIGSSMTKMVPSGSGFATLGTKPDDGAMFLVLNFVLIIGFSIAALIFAKDMATKGAAGVAFKAVAGGMGAATIGAGAWAGRKTIGAASNFVSESKRDAWSKTTAGRAGLWLANKGKNATFDVRGLGNTKFAKNLGADKYLNDVTSLAGKTGTKGFAKLEEEKAKRKTQYAKDVYGKTDEEKEKEEELKEKVEKEEYVDGNGEKQKTNKGKLADVEKEYNKKTKEAEEEEKRAAEEEKKAKEEAEEELNQKKEAATKANPFTGEKREAERALKEAQEKHQKILEEKKVAHEEAMSKKKAIIEDADYARTIKDLKEAYETDKKAYTEAKEKAANRMNEYANRLEKSKISAAMNYAGTATGGATIGGAVGGPIGAAVGGVAGGTLNWWINKNNESRKRSARAVRKAASGKEGKSKKEVKKMLEEAGVLETAGDTTDSASESDKDKKEKTEQPKK